MSWNVADCCIMAMRLAWKTIDSLTYCSTYCLYIKPLNWYRADPSGEALFVKRTARAQGLRHCRGCIKSSWIKSVRCVRTVAKESWNPYTAGGRLLSLKPWRRWQPGSVRSSTWRGVSLLDVQLRQRRRPTPPTSARWLNATCRSGPGRIQ